MKLNRNLFNKMKAKSSNRVKVFLQVDPYLKKSIVGLSLVLINLLVIIPNAQGKSIPQNHSEIDIRAQNMSVDVYSYPFWIRYTYLCYSPTPTELIDDPSDKCPFWEADLTPIDDHLMCCVPEKTSYYYDLDKFRLFKPTLSLSSEDDDFSGEIDQDQNQDNDQEERTEIVVKKPKSKSRKESDSDSASAQEPTLSRITVFANKDYGGTSETVYVFKKCKTLPADWQNRISSMDTNGKCIEVCKDRNCNGNCIRMEPDGPGHKSLEDLNFEKSISSMRACQSKHV